MVYASPADACSPIEPAPRHLHNKTQWIALLRRNSCSFVQKVSIGPLNYSSRYGARFTKNLRKNPKFIISFP